VFIFTLTGIVRIMDLRLPWREIGLLFAAALLAAGVAAVLVIAAPGLWTEFAAGVVYALVYLVLTLRFRAWKRDDAAEILMVAERFPRLLGRVVPRVKRWHDGLE
jgi:uncharacterized membrane protein YfcA